MKSNNYLELLELKILQKSAKKLLKNAGIYTYHTLKLPKTLLPIANVLSSDKDIEQKQLSHLIDNIFTSLYTHPLTKHSQKLTGYLRQNNFLPNEKTTENLIRFVVDQTIKRSPVPVPEPVIEEFWIFFQELFATPELKGLVELNLDIFRLLLKTYEPLIVDIINISKETKRVNQVLINKLLNRVKILRGDLVIIRRQIRALRYIKPFFQTDAKDFKTQAQIVSKMVREFGPFFIKMAQVAAANSNFLPEEISKELMVFQEDVEPMHESQVINAFIDYFGKKPHECYFEFDPKRPIKSGSIGSVYLAKKSIIKNGREILVPVIIKIGRNQLDREFIMGKTAIALTLLTSQYWAPHSKLAPFLEALQEQTNEFVKGFQKELNFEKEAKIQNRFAKRSKDSTIWNVPRVHLASPRILEMEYVKDATNIIQALKNFSYKNKIGFTRKIASKFLYTVLFHIFMYQEFHGDLHPGNVMVTPKGKLYLIDWGNCVNMKGKWQPVWDYFIGAISANVNLLTDALINISSNPKDNIKRRKKIFNTLSETLKKKNIVPLTKHFIFQLQSEGLKGLHKRMQVVFQLMSNTQHLGLVVKSDYLHLSRSFAALIGTYVQIYEGIPKFILIFDLLKILSKFPVDLVKDRFGARRSALYKQIINKLSLISFLINRKRPYQSY